MLVHKEVEFYFKMITFYEEHSDYNEQAAKNPKNKSASRQINVPSASAKLAFDYNEQERKQSQTEVLNSHRTQISGKNQMAAQDC